MAKSRRPLVNQTIENRVLDEVELVQESEDTEKHCYTV